MAGQILPPNTALVDTRGRITTEWYRYLTQLQSSVNGADGSFEDAAILSGDSDGDFFDASSLDDAAMMSPGFLVIDAHDDLRTLCSCGLDFEENLSPVPTFGLTQEEADARYVSPGASATFSVRTVMATASLLSGDYTMLCDATGGAIVINLPAAATSTGRIANIKKIDASANAVTIDPNGAELIDGAATIATTTQWDNYTIQSNGIAWYVL